MAITPPYGIAELKQKAALLRAVEASQTSIGTSFSTFYRFIVMDGISPICVTSWVTSLRNLPDVIQFDYAFRAKMSVVVELKVLYPPHDFEVRRRRLPVKIIRRKPFWLIRPVIPTHFSGQIQFLTDQLRSRLKRKWSPWPRNLGPFTTQRPSPETLTQTFRRWTFNGGTVTENTVSPPRTCYTRSWTGVRTPNFAAKKREKKLPINDHFVGLKWINDYCMVDEFRVIATGQIHTATTRDLQNVLGGSWGNSPPSISATAAVLGARAKAVKRLADRAETSIKGNLALTFAEADQVIRMIGKTVTRITGAIASLKKGNIPGAISQLWNPGDKPRFYTDRRGVRRPDATKPLAENWLELQYGWKPLLSDLRGSMETLAKFNLADYSVSSVRASATSKEESRSVCAENQGGKIWPFGTKVYNLDYQVRYVCRYRVNSHLRSYLAQSGVTNPINLLWEILPFSFVVDWIMPIGPWLESLSNFEGCEFMDGYTIHFFRSSQVIRGYYDDVSPYNPTIHRLLRAGMCTWNEIQFYRLKNTSFPFSPYPVIKNPFSVQHSLNALALLKVAFKRDGVSRL